MTALPVLVMQEFMTPSYHAVDLISVKLSKTGEKGSIRLRTGRLCLNAKPQFDLAEMNGV